METQYTWFKIFNRDEFEALNLVSKTYTLFLGGIGSRDVLVTNGAALGITYDDVFLSLGLGGDNPFVFEGHAIYVDSANDVYLGIEVET